MKRINQIRRKLENARNILACYMTPPDLQKRCEQRAYIKQLEDELVVEAVKEELEIEQAEQARRRRRLSKRISAT